MGIQEISEYLAKLMEPKSPENAYAPGASSPGPWAPRHDFAISDYMNPLPQSQARANPYTGPTPSPDLPSDAKGVEDLQAMTENTPPEAAPVDDRQINLKPLLAYADSAYGGNMARAYDDPNISEDERKAKIEQLKILRDKVTNDRLKAIFDMKEKTSKQMTEDQKTAAVINLLNAKAGKLKAPAEAKDPLKPAQHIAVQNRLANKYEGELATIASKDPVKYKDPRTLGLSIYSKAREVAAAKGVDIPTAYNAIVLKLSEDKANGQ